MPHIKDMKALRHATWQLVFVFTVVSISTFSYGFDNQVYSTIQAMDPFQRRFGEYDAEKGEWGFTPFKLALLNSLGLPLKAVGVVVGGLTGDYLGRKVSFIMMQFLCIIGIAISYTSTTYAQILAGRIIVQAFVGWETLLVPLYSAEIAPASIRGALLGLFVFAHQFGAFLCSFVTFSSSKYDTDFCWKLPLAIGFVFPCSMVLVSWWIPESPRWLVRKGKEEKAVKNLEWLNGSTSGADARAEVAVLKAAIDEDHATQESWSHMLKGTNKIRTQITIVSGIFNQLTGQAFSTQYGTLFVKSLHSINPFTFNVISRFVQALGPFVIFCFIDVVGRRPVYLVFGAFCAAVLLTQGGLGTGELTPERKEGIVAMTTLFSFFYSGGFGAVGAIIGAEVPHLRLRDKTNIVNYVVHQISDFLVVFTLPYLLKDLGSKVGFIYGSVSVLGVIWAWFYLPETLGRSLEELEEMWRAKVPPRKFRSWKPEDRNSDKSTDSDAAKEGRPVVELID